MVDLGALNIEHLILFLAKRFTILKILPIIIDYIKKFIVNISVLRCIMMMILSFYGENSVSFYT